MALGEIGSQSEIITATHTQTLSNKTLDADNNTISNLEVDNLKTGVLSTDLDAAVDNNNIAGAQAIKDYVAARVAEKDDASEITYTPADGTDYDVVPTLVDGALDELASRTNTVEDNLTAHLNADPAKHAAAQITNVAAGNIAATTVQGAINELDTEKYIAASFDGDFDTRLATKDTDNLAESATNKYASPAQLDKVDFNGSSNQYNLMNDLDDYMNNKSAKDISGLNVINSNATTPTAQIKHEDNDTISVRIEFNNKMNYSDVESKVSIIDNSSNSGVGFMPIWNNKTLHLVVDTDNGTSSTVESNPLTSGTTYKVSLLGTAKDSDGNTLGSDVVKYITP
jgi:hypothetical protein